MFADPRTAFLGTWRVVHSVEFGRAPPANLAINAPSVPATAAERGFALERELAAWTTSISWRGRFAPTHSQSGRSQGSRYCSFGYIEGEVPSSRRRSRDRDIETSRRTKPTPGRWQANCATDEVSGLFVPGYLGLEKKHRQGPAHNRSRGFPTAVHLLQAAWASW